MFKILPLPVGIGRVKRKVNIGKKQNKKTLSNPDPRNFESKYPIIIDIPKSITSLTPYPRKISLLTFMFFGIRYIYIPPIHSSFICKS